MTGARIFYSDGEYSGDSPPARDVQLIVQSDGAGPPYFQSGTDYYVKRDGRWLGVDIFGLFDYLMDTGLVLFGRTITNAEYQAIYQKAKLFKSTWQPGERRP